MKILLQATLALIFALFASAADDTPAKPTDDVVFRQPFTLKLHVDKEHFYEEKFDRIPYVHDGNVYLFKGDEFGVSLDTKDGVVRHIRYQPKAEKADITLKFSQEVEADGSAMMMLHIQNNTAKKVFIDAIMTVPDQNGIRKTSILPVEPKLAGFEGWPHPIVQLVLRNIRFTK